MELAAHCVAGALGGDHADVVSLLGHDVAVADVEAVGEEQGRVGLEVRGDLLGVDEALHLVGDQDHDDIAFLDGFGNVLHFKAGGLGLLPGGGAGTKTDHHVDARILEVERVSVTLRAVADDGDLLGLDDRQISAIVVDDLGHCHFSFS